MPRNQEAEKFIRYLWRNGLSINKRNIDLLKNLVKQNKIIIDE
jgi:hypothetical protein